MTKQTYIKVRLPRRPTVLDMLLAMTNENIFASTAKQANKSLKLKSADVEYDISASETDRTDVRVSRYRKKDSPY